MQKRPDGAFSDEGAMDGDSERHRKSKQIICIFLQPQKKLTEFIYTTAYAVVNYVRLAQDYERKDKEPESDAVNGKSLKASLLEVVHKKLDNNKPHYKT